MQTQTTGTAKMTETAAGEFLTSDHLGKYLAGLARLDAAVRAGCELCGGPVERTGVDMVECQAQGCYWCKSTEAH